MSMRIQNTAWAISMPYYSTVQTRIPSQVIYVLTKHMRGKMTLNASVRGLENVFCLLYSSWHFWCNYYCFYLVLNIKRTLPGFTSTVESGSTFYVFYYRSILNTTRKDWYLLIMSHWDDWKVSAECCQVFFVLFSLFFPWDVFLG